MTAPLFDTHCHLDFDSFGEDRTAVLERARAAGVRRITTIGAGRGADTAGGAIAVARANSDWITATVGIHPHDASTASDDAVARIEALAADPIVVGVGEIGLDFHYDHSPRDVQREAFRKLIAVARRVKKPIVIHTRNAADETLAILRDEHARDVGGIIHCFSEDTAFAKAALDLGFVASFSGIVTFKNAVAIREAARVQPSDSILVETDAPFLAPIPYRGKRNEPAYVEKTLACIAELRGDDPATLARSTADNACRVFRLPLID